MLTSFKPLISAHDTGLSILISRLRGEGGRWGTYGGHSGTMGRINVISATFLFCLTKYAIVVLTPCVCKCALIDIDKPSPGYAGVSLSLAKTELNARGLHRTYGLRLNPIISSSWVEMSSHTKFQLPRLP